MTIFRNEVRTGVLVITTLAVLVGVILYLGSPGVFTPQKKFRIYFDNASGLQPGAPVLLAGRKIGQVTMLHSPVEEDRRPKPELETLVEIQVEASAKIFQTVRARMTLPSLLGKPVIDFTSGQSASGLAPDDTEFIGERQPGLSEALPVILAKLDPVLKKATETLASLKDTADHLKDITKEGSDLPLALAEYKKFGAHLNELSGPDSSLRKSLANFENLTGEQGKLAESLNNISKLTGPEGDLAKAMANAETFTAKLADNKDIEATLKNLRGVSENMDHQITKLSNQLSVTAKNLATGSDTLKRQPWRLIWPATKKYPNDPGPEETAKLAEKKDRGGTSGAGGDKGGGSTAGSRESAVRRASLPINGNGKR